MASIAGMGNIRLWADAAPAEIASLRARLFAETVTRHPDSSVQMLALSSGSDDGAYAAGLLAGWTESGLRPEFTYVTGVSTGALIAPFAFLGSNHDDSLKDFYTGITQKDIFRRRGISGILSGPSVADTAPLKALIAKYIDYPLIDEIARQHYQGRRLYILTTNLDAGRGVIWDIGAIASRNNAARLELIRNIVLASASVPGMFPPVLIEAKSGGQKFQEMHVDGATTSGLLVAPEAALWTNDSVGTRGNLYLILNGKLHPDFEVVKPGSVSIMARALNTILYAQDRKSIINSFNYAKELGLQFHMSSIGADFEEEAEEIFDPQYMSKLYNYARRRGRGNTHWRSNPVE